MGSGEAEVIDLFELASSPFQAGGGDRAAPEPELAPPEPERAPPEPERAPARLEAANESGMFRHVLTDMRTVRYVGVSTHCYDVGAAQADAPAPADRLVYYFEMTVKDAGKRGRVAIGFTPPGFNLCYQPGWKPNSIGYHGDDGCLFHGEGYGERFGPTYTLGDTVGAGINYGSQELFFTKNGKLVGKVCKGIQGPLYPTVAVHSQNEEVTVNFGMEPFLYDMEALMREERLKKKAAIENLSLPSYISHWILRSYLLHYGYQDTLISFDVESANNHIPFPQENGISQQEDSYALNHRKILRQLIKNGDVDSAVHKLQEWYPQVLQSDTSTICLLLHSQRFIDYVRVGQLVEAVKYARAELAKFFKVKRYRDFLQDTIAVLAYDDPKNSGCIGYHLSESRREFVADAVNAMVLATNPDMKVSNAYAFSCLEKLLRQLSACSLERRAINGGEDEIFNLQELLKDRGNMHR